VAAAGVRCGRLQGIGGELTLDCELALGFVSLDRHAVFAAPDDIVRKGREAERYGVMPEGVVKCWLGQCSRHGHFPEKG